MSKNTYVRSFISILLIISISLMNVNIALADDGTPPEVTDTPTEEPVQPTEEPSEPTAIETPVVGETPPSEEAIPTETEAAPSNEEQVPAENEATPSNEEQVSSGTETSDAGPFSQVPDNTDVVVLDENGDPLPLVTEEALGIILETDPMWCPAGVLPGEAGCTINFGSITDLISNMNSNTGSYDQAGIIYFTANTGGSFTLTAGILGTGDFNTLKDNNLTLQGGWNGLNGVNATFDTQTNFGNNALTIGTSGNPWVGNITLNNFSFSGVSSTNAVTVYTTSGDITLNNVDVAQQAGEDYTALLDSNSGDIVVQNGSSFDGNNSSTAQNRGFSADTNTGSITITGTSGTPITFNEAHGCLGTCNFIGELVENYNGATLSAPTITLTYVTANGNDQNGIAISNANIITLNQVVATNNGTEIPPTGLSNNAGSGVLVNGNAGSLLIVTGGTFSNNQRYGIEVNAAPNIFVHAPNPTCTGNDGNGGPGNPCFNRSFTLDNTAPTTSPSQTPAANGNGWNNTDVTVNWNWSDGSGTGINTASCTTSTTSSGEGVMLLSASCSDRAGNIGNASYTVRVDKTAPTLNLPENIIAEATSPSGAVVTYSVPVNDNLDSSITVNCNPPTGNSFLLDTVSTVNCSATDDAGNTVSGNFTISVVDTTGPSISSHADITEEATSAAGAVVSYTSPSTSDAVDGAGTATCSPASGVTFALGITTVMCNATDAHGNAATPNTFDVTVQDTTAPIIASHADITEEATSAAGAMVNYTNPATSDAVDGPGIATCSPASGSTFALSVTTVTCNATDGHGNAATPTSFTVTVEDTTAPIIAPHGDITEEATSAAGAVVNYTSPPTSDAVDGTGPATCSPSSGSIFAFGDTTVTCTATDAHGNVATPTSFVVSVQDTTAPVIDTHPDIAQEATSAAGAVVNYISPSTSDAVDGPGVSVCSPVSGSTFALGITTVTCDAVDSHGNIATPVTFTITVEDTTAPVIAAHPDVIIEATSAAGASVNYTSPATSDAVDGPGVATCSPASGTTFGLGTTTVTCNASDSNGNLATPTTFNVTVQDTTAPIIAAHADVIEEATSAAGATVNYTSPSTSDAVDGPGVATCTPASGSTFAIGDTTITCNATDSHGNVATQTTFTVTVEDTTAPVIAPHADITEEATSAAGTTVSYASPSTSDAVDGPGTATCSPASGSTFAIGDTTVTCNATDAHGNAATPVTFTVTVQDTTPPALNLPANIIVEATGSSGATVTFSASSLDLVDGPVTVTCSPASGSTFPLGTTTVDCYATDAHGNTGSGSFAVTVQDTTGPTLSLPANITAEATGSTGAIVTYSASATDIVAGPVPVSCSPVSASMFALGTTTVNCSAADANSNTTNGSFTVTVQDTTPPVIEPHANKGYITNHNSGKQEIHYSLPSTFDIVDGEGKATCTPASGSTFQLGTTVITCTAVDSHGNVATPVTFTIRLEFVEPDYDNGGIIPVTGGETIPLDCDTTVMVAGIKVTFFNLCNHQAILNSRDVNSLPGKLPNGVSFVMGLDIAVLHQNQTVNPLPAGTGIEMDFPTGDSKEKFTVLFWDDGQWVEISQLIDAKDLAQALTKDADNELYQITPLESSLLKVLTAEETGIFVLVKK